MNSESVSIHPRTRTDTRTDTHPQLVRDEGDAGCAGGDGGLFNNGGGGPPGVHVEGNVHRSPAHTVRKDRFQRSIEGFSLKV